MEIDVAGGALARIWEQLNTNHRPGRSDGERTAHVDIISDGWGVSCDIQDVLWETDDRADMLARHNDDFECLLAPYNLHFESRYRGPVSKLSEVWGHKAMRASDIAMYIMEIERLGFSVDAEPLVASLRPTLIRQKFLTNSELSVVWYKKQRHRCEPIILRVEGGNPISSEAITTQSGYKAIALLDEKRQPVVLRVEALKARKGFPLKYWIAGELNRAGSHAEFDAGSTE
ncbi:hypothetical protein [Sphingomonas sp.]|jgi:hypothetical protein|uniref:hypothetical protein n=1 Tax=Sphingomonas sp. TaxID=28214 RepID=UPI002E3352BF|nr:hypothetical protein [Sphingomonas sp.]HEX4694935.1 hypothetical protein [Sphingomonas sp.]